MRPTVERVSKVAPQPQTTTHFSYFGWMPDLMFLDWGAKSVVRAQGGNKGRGIAALLLLVPACGRSEDATWAIDLKRRAESLRSMPLPTTNSVEGCPSVVLVNSLVPSTLIASEPTRAEVRIGEELVGVTPCEVPTSRLLSEDGAFAVTLRAFGRPITPTGYRLRFEAADFGCGVDRDQLPEELRRRDHFLFLVCGAAAESAESAPAGPESEPGR